MRDREVATHAPAAPAVRRAGAGPNQQLGRRVVPRVDLEIELDRSRRATRVDTRGCRPRRELDTEGRERDAEWLLELEPRIVAQRVRGARGKVPGFAQHPLEPVEPRADRAVEH